MLHWIIALLVHSYDKYNTSNLDNIQIVKLSAFRKRSNYKDNDECFVKYLKLDWDNNNLINCLEQACTTYGPRAKCGPPRLLIWPTKPQILFSLLASLIKTPFECVKNDQLWPLDVSKKFIWPAMRFELCTPGLELDTNYRLTLEDCYLEKYTELKL